MLTIVKVDGGQVLGVVDGRNSAAVGGWLAERSPAWRRIQVLAIDPSGVQEGGALSAVVTPLMAVPRVRAFAAHDEPGAGRVAVGWREAGDFADLRPLAQVAVPVDGRDPVPRCTVDGGSMPGTGADAQAVIDGNRSGGQDRKDTGCF